MRRRRHRSSARTPERQININPARSPLASQPAQLPLRIGQRHVASSGHTSPQSYRASRRLPKRMAPTMASHLPTLRMGGRMAATRQARRQAAGSSPSRAASRASRGRRPIKGHEACHIILARAHHSSASIHNSHNSNNSRQMVPAERHIHLMVNTMRMARQSSRNAHRGSKVASRVARPIPAAMEIRRGSAGTPADPISSATSPAGATSRRQTGAALRPDADSHSRGGHSATRLAIRQLTRASHKRQPASSR